MLYLALGPFSHVARQRACPGGMYYRWPVCFPFGNGNAMRLCVPVHPVYRLAWRQLGVKVHYLG